MFATLVGTLPSPARARGREDRLRVQLEAQVAAGMDLLSFAEPAPPTDALVDAWLGASRLAEMLGDRPVKAAIIGPMTVAHGSPNDSDVDATRAVVDALGAAGCPLVEIHEPVATAIGADEVARGRFRAAHEHLVDGISVHACLAITGGNADPAGAETLFVAGYRSFLFDLILGPDNWRLIAAAPAGAGIVAGAIDHRAGVREVPETGVWAGHYAASTGGRGIERVGLATAGSLAGLDWDQAVARMSVLGEAARVAAMPRGEGMARAMDPRALDIRSAAMGRYAPHRSRRARP
ncbi:MAG TPA: hypothetical protein VGK63_02930, partial [Candidatus Limnocylindrales bacterium]